MMECARDFFKAYTVERTSTPITTAKDTTTQMSGTVKETSRNEWVIAFHMKKETIAPSARPMATVMTMKHSCKVV